MKVLSDSWTGIWHCVGVTYYDWDTDYEESTSFVHSGFAGATLHIDPNGVVRFDATSESEDYNFEVRCSGNKTLCVDEIEAGCFDTFTSFQQRNGQLEFIARLIPDCQGGETDSLILVFARSVPDLSDPNDILQIATTLEDNEVEMILESAEEDESGTLNQWAKTLWEATVAGDYPSGKAVDEEEEPFYAYLQILFLEFLSDESFGISFDWLTHDLVRRGFHQLDPSKELFSSQGRLNDIPSTFAELVKNLPVHDSDATLAEAMSPAWFPYFDPKSGPETFFVRPIFPPAFHEFWHSKES